MWAGHWKGDLAIWNKGKKRIKGDMFESYEGTLNARELLHKRTGRLAILNPKLTYQSIVIPFWDNKGYQRAIFTGESYIRAEFENRNIVTRKAFWTKMFVQRQSQLLLLEVGVI